MVGTGTSAEYARSQVEMFGELAQGITRAEPRTPDSTTPTRLAEWSARELRPAVQSLPDESMPAAHPGLVPLAEIWPTASSPDGVQLIRLT